jgi:hypothetical protein
VPAEGGRPVRTGAIRALYRQGVIKEGERTGDYWPSEWFRDRIIFRAGRGDDSIHVWDIPLNPKTFQVDGDARQITFGGAREALPAVSDDGTLVFCGQIIRRDFWGVPLDPDSGKVSSTERRQLTTNTASNDGIGFATRDGKSVIFNSLRSGNSDIRRIDFGSHTDNPLVATPAQEYLLGISSDGSKILHSALESKERVLYAGSAADGSLQKVCARCSAVLSPDGSAVYYSAPDPKQERREVSRLDLAAGTRSRAFSLSKEICFPCTSSR